MERKTGTVSRGIRCPIIREGDDIATIVVNSVTEAAEAEGFALRDRDVVAVTESVVARAQGNYASVDAIAKDVKAKLGGGTIGVIFPILSRNRFAICLRGIAKGAKKIVLMLNYPSDEVEMLLYPLTSLTMQVLILILMFLPRKNTASFSARILIPLQVLIIYSIMAI